MSHSMVQAPTATLENPGENVFRHEVVARHAASLGEGDLLRVDLRWTRWVLRTIALVVVCFLAFSCVLSVDEYATGPAVVRVEGRRTVTATFPATVGSVLVRPGQHVAAGELLVQMDDSTETAELRRVATEFDLALARLLRDPTDAVATQTLGALRSKRDLAKNALDERLVRAPVDGVVGDVRVHPGQRLAAGDSVIAIAPKAARITIVAAVPGDHRPMIEQEAPVRFSLDGFAYEYRDLRVEAVSEEVVGPSEVKRYFGQEQLDSVQMLPGAKALVTARIEESTFASEGARYGYYDGLTGVAEIRVRREPILVMLIPALKTVLPR